MKLLLVSFARSFLHGLKYYIIFLSVAIILVNIYGAFKAYPVFAEFKQNMVSDEELFLERSLLSMDVHKDDSYFVVVEQIFKFVATWGWEYTASEGILLYLYYSLISIFIWAIILLPSHYICSKKSLLKKESK